MFLISVQVQNSGGLFNPGFSRLLQLERTKEVSLMIKTQIPWAPTLPSKGIFCRKVVYAFQVFVSCMCSQRHLLCWLHFLLCHHPLCNHSMSPQPWVLLSSDIAEATKPIFIKALKLQSAALENMQECFITLLPQCSQSVPLLPQHHVFK